MSDDVAPLYDPDGVYPCSPNTQCDGFTKLMYLIIRANVIPNCYEVIKNYLIENKETINYQNKLGWTALMIAARNSNVVSNEIVELLLLNGADPNIKNNAGFTALVFAVWVSNCDSNIDTVNLLLKYGADVYSRSNQNLLVIIYACYTTGNIATVKLLLHNMSNKRYYLNAALGTIAIANRVSIKTMKLLLDLGADPNHIDNDSININITTNGYICDHSYLIYAAGNIKNIKNSKLLLKRGANINYQNALGDTALILTTHSFNSRAVCLDPGESLPMRTLKIIKLLLEYGADPNLANNKKKTALMYAIKYLQYEYPNNVNSIRLLLDYGADPYVSDAKGNNIFSMCTNKDVIELFYDRSIIPDYIRRDQLKKKHVIRQIFDYGRNHYKPKISR